MINLAEELKCVRSVAIAGHIRPDGDAVGSSLGLYHYLRNNYPDIETTVYLETVPDAFGSFRVLSRYVMILSRKKNMIFFSASTAQM